MATVPPSLAAWAARLRPGPGRGPRPHPVIDAAMARFGAGPAATRSAAVSEWSMYYFAALIIPTLTRAICTGRAPPVAIDDVGCDVDAAGRVVGFWVGADESPAGPACLDPLVADHLEAMVASCHRLSGLSPRVLWSNAAVTLDYAVGELRGAGADHAMLRAAAALLADHPRLARPFRDGERARKICCLRYRLPGGEMCAGICPRGTRPDGSRPCNAFCQRPLPVT